MKSGRRIALLIVDYLQSDPSLVPLAQDDKITMAKIKICGITNLSDAQAASQLGADAVGFIFAKSPRRISPSKAGKIAASLPPFISKVGVFVNEKSSRVNKIAKECRLDYVQLHGEESPEYVKKIKLPVIKALRIKDRSTLRQIKKLKVEALLLDTYEKGRRGGTGKTFNWNIAKAAKKFGIPVILSGGLTPGNVSRAIKKVKPYAVDASSGVELYPGKKSIMKLKKFIKRAISAKP